MQIWGNTVALIKGKGYFFWLHLWSWVAAAVSLLVCWWPVSAYLIFVALKDQIVQMYMMKPQLRRNGMPLVVYIGARLQRYAGAFLLTALASNLFPWSLLPVGLGLFFLVIFTLDGRTSRLMNRWNERVLVAGWWIMPVAAVFVDPQAWRSHEWWIAVFMGLFWMVMQEVNAGHLTKKEIPDRDDGNQDTVDTMNKTITASIVILWYHFLWIPLTAIGHWL